MSEPDTSMAVSRRGILSLAVLPIALPVAAHPLIEMSDARAGGDDMGMTVVDLGGSWRFRTDPYAEGERAGWSAPTLDDASWEETAVPGVWDVINEYAEYAGQGWYRVTFDGDAAWADRLVRLKFDGVYNDAKVWLNGQALGTNAAGYLPFEFDVSKLLRIGGRNQLTVRADNRVRVGAVWNWGGIRGPVSLEITPRARIKSTRIVAVPDLARGSAGVTVRARASIGDAADRTLRARLSLWKDGILLWRSEPLAGSPDGAGEIAFAFERVLPPKQVQLWHFNTPQLYVAEVELWRDGTRIHAQRRRFGIRKVEVTAGELKLNGEPIRTVGFNVVAEDRRTGSFLPPSSFKADVDRMKMLGANMARLSHLPLPSDYMDYLDEVGMLVISEIPVWGKSDLVRPNSTIAIDWMTRLIDLHFNHPSVIGWSVGNEIGRLDRNPQAPEYIREMIVLVRSLDPSRFALYVSNTAQNSADDPARYADFTLINGYDRLRERVEKTHGFHPSKPIFLSEYGAGLDAEDPDKATIDAEAFLKPLRDLPYLAGVSLWTFNDYRSAWPGWPGSPATGASQNRSWGVVTSDRRPKRSHATYRRAHAPIARMALAAEGARTVTLTPRPARDLPSYRMRGYRLLWQLVDASGESFAAGTIGVPPLDPGGAPVTLRIPDNARAARLLVDLIDPQGYSILQEKADWAAPATPSIRSVLTSVRTARIAFEPVPLADEYVVLYRDATGEKSSAPSINAFIDVAGLELGKSYDFRVVALNAAGRSSPSASVGAATNPDDLPPIVWSVQSGDRTLFVNYSNETTDSLFDVEVAPMNGAASWTISATTHGIVRVPRLQNGKAYRLRMRRHNGLGFISAWSEWQSGMPFGAGGLPAPRKGFARRLDGGALLLVFDPVENAAGYRLQIGRESVAINRSASGTAIVRARGDARGAVLRAVDDHGKAGAAVKLRAF